MAAAVRAALSPNTWPCNSTTQAPYSQTYSAYSSIFAIMQKSIDSASVCLHKGDSCACLSSIVELFLGFLKEDINCVIKHTELKAADLFSYQSQHNISSQAMLEKNNDQTISSYALARDGN